MLDDTTLPEGTLPEMISPYMRQLIASTGGETGPIGRQFLSQPAKERRHQTTKSSDPLIEEAHEVAPGMIYKYVGRTDRHGNIIQFGRLLWTISRFCATYCRFCFRGRIVGLPVNKSRATGETMARKAYLSKEDLQTCFAFIRSHPEINEVILSGGDPLVVPALYFQEIVGELATLQREGNLDFVRIHTRAPITNPSLVQPWHYETIAKLHNPFIALHINHPAEITPEVIAIADKLRHDCNAMLYSQTVLLKGVNDSVETLSTLFRTMAKHGIRPYYLHYNDPVYWAAHFTVPMKRAINIWQQLRPRLSGITATARFVIDTPFGHGKVAIPDGSFDVDYSHFIDFRGKEHLLDL